MEALLTTFVAAALAEWGDKTQLLVAAFAVRFGRPASILVGVGVAALANALSAAAGGALLHDLITLRALGLLVALALMFAAIGGFGRAKQPELGAGWRSGALLTTAGCVFLLEFGDKTQFLTAALAARYDSFLLAAVGAAAGVVAASIPAALLADRFARLKALHPLRIGIAGLFLLTGFVVAINALRLI